MMRALDLLAYVLGYASLTVTACTIAIAAVVLARGAVERLTEDRRARRDALADLVDLRTGELRPARDVPREPALGRRRSRQ